MANKNIIWSSEYDYDEEFDKEQYQEYLDNYEPSKPMDFESWKNDYFENNGYVDDTEINEEDYTDEELKEMYNDYVENYQDPGPLDFEKWQFGFTEQNSNDQWEVKEENLQDIIFPMIANQCNDDLLILLGSVGRWNGNFNGGKIIKNDYGEFAKVMSDYDEVDITEEDNNQLCVNFHDHDASTNMNLFTLPKEEKDLLELAKSMGYEKIVKEEYEEDTLQKYPLDELILDKFHEDIGYDNIDLEDLAKNSDKLIPIVNKQQTEELTEALENDEEAGTYKIGLTLVWGKDANRNGSNIKDTLTNAIKEYGNYFTSVRVDTINKLSEDMSDLSIKESEDK